MNAIEQHRYSEWAAYEAFQENERRLVSMRQELSPSLATLAISAVAPMFTPGPESMRPVELSEVRDMEREQSSHTLLATLALSQTIATPNEALRYAERADFDLAA